MSNAKSYNICLRRRTFRDFLCGSPYIHSITLPPDLKIIVTQRATEKAQRTTEEVFDILELWQILQNSAYPVFNTKQNIGIFFSVEIDFCNEILIFF